MLLIIISSCGLVYYLFNYGTQQSKPDKDNFTAIIMGNPMASKPVVFGFNNWLAKLASPWIAKSKKDVSWAVSLPHTKLAAAACFYVLLIVANTMLIDDIESHVIDLFLIILMGTIMLAIFMESRQLIRQTITIAHLFTPPNNRGIKQKIMSSINKNIIVNCTTLTILVLAFVSLMGVQPDYLYLSVATITVMGIGISFYPLMLCLNWQRVSVPLVAALVAMAFTIFIACYWLKTSPLSEWFTWQPLVFAGLLGTIHQVSRQVYYRFPFEKLLINK